MLVAKIFQCFEQSVLEMVKDMCDDIYQEELLAIQSRDFLVSVDILRNRKYVLHKLARNICQMISVQIWQSRDTINTGPEDPRTGTQGPRFLRAVLHCSS